MLKSYLRVALRNLVKQKLYTSVNILGLAIGLAGCLLIMCFIVNELSYENNHQNKDRIYRVAGQMDFGDFSFPMATQPAPLKQAIVDQSADVEKATCFQNRKAVDVRVDNQVYSDNRLIYADPEFLEIFTMPLYSGDPSSQLLEPFTTLISKSASSKYFGAENPIGKIISLKDDIDLRITGVLEDISANTQIQADLIASFSTLEKTAPELLDWDMNSSIYIYLLLNENASQSSIEQIFPAILENNANEEFAQTMTLFLQPLGEIYMHSHLSNELKPSGNMGDIYLFTIIATLILMIACANFINLSTAKTNHRLKEIGVRKVMGANKGHLIKQFIGESVLMTFFAMLLGLALFEIGKPYLSAYLGKSIDTSIWSNLYLQLSVLALIITVGVVSGFYPSFYLSRINVIKIIKGHNQEKSSRSILRKALVIFQYAAAVGLIFITLSISQMIDFLKTKDLGYSTEHIMMLDLGDEIENRAEKCTLFKNELSRIPEIEVASAMFSPPGRSSLVFNIMQAAGDSSEESEEIMVNTIRADYDFMECFGLELIAGRNFSPDFESDQKQGIIINETAVERFGFDNPIGQKIESSNGEYYVVGILKDFHSTSLRNPIMPMSYLLRTDKYESIAVKMPAENSAEVRTRIASIWEAMFPEQPFSYSYLTDEAAGEYKGEEKIGILFTIFAFLALLIACLGAFGLASYAAEQRTREIGIRKVLGASLFSIMRMISKEFIILVAVACVISWPIAYYLISKGLQEFPFRPTIGFDVFLYSGFIAFIIALATVSYQALKAATSNPIDAIRSE